ncbi:MAG: aminopeptidase P family protein [Muribaculaceae bacterium]|nr:aminopeptidase P family protein [Muribaculaceae bacterium]
MNYNLLSSEKQFRKEAIVKALKSVGADAILISDNSNIYYTFGSVISGYTFINSDGVELFFIRRPVGLSGDDIRYIRKPENIIEHLAGLNISIPKTLALELDTLSYNDTARLILAMNSPEVVNGSAIMRNIRSVKSDFEIEKLIESGVHHANAYSKIPSLYKSGMTDFELQVEIERVLRLEGCLGQFRISGQSMEMYMGNLLCGDNADAPSPYDFAMGGAGMDASLPVGCCGTTIKPGTTVMVDMCGNFTGYMTDMTRTFCVGDIPEEARVAHQLSIDICNRISREAVPGVAASSLYEIALDMVKSAGMDDFFMGHKQKAGFIGHGVGIEVNESPVIAPRSKDIIHEGNVIALEPKFVIPSVGAVGVENTYVARAGGLECITTAPLQLISLQ